MFGRFLISSSRVTGVRLDARGGEMLRPSKRARSCLSLWLDWITCWKLVRLISHRFSV